VISFVFIGSFIILYAALGTWLILQGIGIWKPKAPSSSAPAPLPYAKLGDPPLR
jgi:hypothetical protein